MGKKKERKGKSIVWFGPDDEHFTGVHFKGIKESVKGLPPTYGGTEPIDHIPGPKRPWPDYWRDRQDKSTDPYKQSKKKKTKKKRKKK